MADAEAKKAEPRPKAGKALSAALARYRPDWRVLMPLAAATLLLILGLFLAWQSWLVLLEQNGAAQIERVRTWEVAALGAEIAQTTRRVEAALGADAVRTALASEDAAGRDAAAAALKQVLPEVQAVDFYSPALNEVISGDLARFGYAKAQMLMQAQAHVAPAPVQVRAEKGEGMRLILALPVKSADSVLGYAYVKLPFAPILATFRRAGLAGARLDLRQGDGHGDQLIASIGDLSGNSIGDLGTPIPGSSLRIGAGQADHFIAVSRNPWLLLPLTVLCLLAGLFALWARQVGMERALATLRRAPDRKQEEVTLAQAMKQQPVSAPAAAVKSTPPKPAAADAPVSVDRSIFRAYDIRGVLGKTLTPGVAHLIGRAIGSEARARGLHEIVVGRDGRLSGPDLSGALIDGLRTSGIDVIDIGQAPTPVIYFAAYHLNTGSCVSVTGSHNPPDYNGFKIVLGGETLSEGAIQDLYARISANTFSDGSGNLQTMNLAREYTERIAADIQIEKKLKVVVDCGNGVPGAIAPGVLEAVGCEVIPLYCEVDGSFPNHHPDPSDPHNLQDLILSVKQTGADLGLAFDGDGDRLGVVTASGEVIFPDRLLMLFAMDVLTRNPGGVIIYDVKCTGHLQPLILQHGGSPLMWKTGHSLIKAKMRETQALLAGEMSGHFFFAERWYGFDDGIYSAARLLEIIAGDPDGRTPQQIFDALPKGVSTPELKIPMHEGEHYRFIETFRQKATFEGARITTIDGVRADWPDGWGLVRASNTTPVLVLRFDADNDPALARIKDVFRAQLKAIDASLPLPF